MAASRGRRFTVFPSASLSSGLPIFVRGESAEGAGLPREGLKPGGEGHK